MAFVIRVTLAHKIDPNAGIRDGLGPQGLGCFKYLQASKGRSPKATNPFPGVIGCLRGEKITECPDSRLILCDESNQLRGGTARPVLPAIT